MLEPWVLQKYQQLETVIHSYWLLDNIKASLDDDVCVNIDNMVCGARVNGLKVMMR